MAEPKTAKNRCHVDLHVDAREAVVGEVDRLTDLGATVIRAPKEEWGAYWPPSGTPKAMSSASGPVTDN